MAPKKRCSKLGLKVCDYPNTATTTCLHGFGSSVAIFAQSNLLFYGALFGLLFFRLPFGFFRVGKWCRKAGKSWFWRRKTYIWMRVCRHF